MDKKQIEKNILDLEYRKLTQILCSVLTISAAGILGIYGSFTLLNQNQLKIGLSISAIILVISIGVIKKINGKLKFLIEDLDKSESFKINKEFKTSY